MNIDENAFSSYSNTMTEESCFATTHNNNESSICRVIGHKKKFVAFFTGDMDAAAKMYELCQEYPITSGGESAILTTCNFVKLVSVPSFLSFSCSSTCRCNSQRLSRWFNWLLFC